MKKLTALLLVSVMLTGLVGCSSTVKTETSEETEKTGEVSEETSKDTEAEQEGVSSEVTPDESEESLPERWRPEPLDDLSFVEPYKEIIDSYEADNEDGTITYELIHVNDDLVPELVVFKCDDDYSQRFFNLYAFVDGEVKTLLKDYEGDPFGNTMAFYAPYCDCIMLLKTEVDSCSRDYYTMDRLINGEDPFSAARVMMNPDNSDYYINDKEVTSDEFYEALPLETAQEGLYGWRTADAIYADMDSGIIPQEHCFKIFMADVTWKEAQRQCLEMGGYLATYNDYAAEYWSEGEWDHEDCILYIGAYYDDTDKVFYWIDDEKEAVEEWDQIWAFGDPSDKPGDKYLARDTTGLSGYPWYTYVPNNILEEDPSYEGRIGFVCEFDHFVG